MALPVSRAQLRRELTQLQKEVALLTKVVVQNRRLIAFLEYTRSSSGWAYIPTAGNFPIKNGGISALWKGREAELFDVVSVETLAAHKLKESQL